MTQEEKDLLLKDICTRLSYGVKVEYGIYVCEVLSVDIFNQELTIRICNGYCPNVKLEDVKPCLFPLSSMTDEQREEFLNIQAEERKILFDALIEYRYGKCDKKPVIASYKQIDWYNKNHFDYRGLIPMGLASDATGLNIY